MSRPGSRSHSESSMLRIRAETRVLDCATPCSSTRSPLLHDLDEIHAFGDRVDELVEQMNDLGARALQLSDDLHAREQPLALGLEAVDLGDLLVELGDLAAQDLVAALLRARPALHRELGHVHDAGSHDQACRRGRREILSCAAGAARYARAVD